MGYRLYFPAGKEIAPGAGEKKLGLRRAGPLMAGGVR
jgi:hypothetical protein